jgi:nucleoside-diphosphate-sugar epimerase
MPGGIVNRFLASAAEIRRKSGECKDERSDNGRRCVSGRVQLPATVFAGDGTVPALAGVPAHRPSNEGNEMATSHEKTSVRDIAELEELLSEPTEAAIHALGALDGDIIILGAGGKMGPSLARMAKKASEISGVSRRVIAVSRFSSSQLEFRLQQWGVETLRCDLLDRKALCELPDAANMVYMAGMKFGSTGQESLTWAMNSFLPGLVSERYCKSRIAAFSTGNVYGLSPVGRGGSQESDPPNPVGEYAMSCLGRERIFQHFSRTNHTKMSILRLNYAGELRYGVLVDIAERVFRGQVVPLSMGYLNAIWQGDASAMSLQSLGHASEPPFVINVAGPELLSVRRIAEEFGKRLHKPVRLEGEESGDALLSNANRAYGLFGHPRVSIEQMLTWIADWVSRGGETLAKPTHFEERAGRF